MNREDRFDSKVRGYLHAQAAREAPPYLLARGMAGVRDARQRPSWTDRFAASWMLAGLGAATVAAVLVAVVVGLPPPSPGSVGPSSSSSPTATAATSPVATPTASLVPALPGFTTNAPTAPDATWTTLTWRKLAEDDALAQVRKVVRWSGGFIALGIDQASGDTTWTPVWASSDGVAWSSLSPVTFGLGTIIFDVVELPSGGGLVALTGAGHAEELTTGPVQSWSSSDGLTWNAHPGPDLIPPEGRDSSQRPLLVAGPAGAIASTHGRLATAAISPDGVAWTLLPADALPEGFTMGAMAGTADGYVAVGSIPVDVDHDQGAALWSADGLHWTQAPRLVARGGNVLAASGPAPWGATGLLMGRSGFLALGRVFATPGADIWWQSDEGRHWQNLTNYPPLGPTTGEGEGVGGGPNGWVASDGQRLLAGRFAGDAAWVSADGLRWSLLAISGPPLVDEPSRVTVLPGGVLMVQLTDTGSVAWFGEAAEP